MQMELTLKQWMALKDVTIKELAQRSGLSEATICHIRTGKHKPNINTLQKLAAALDLKLADIKL